MSWPMVKLGEICRLEYGKNLPSADRISGDYEVFGSNGPVGTHTSAFTKGKTVVVGRKGSIGEAAFSAKPCWPIDTTYYVDEAGTEQDLRWLYYLISSLNLRRFNKATGVPSLNRADAYDCEIPLPPLEEQKRIAGILDQADALRRLRARALEKLKVLEEGIVLESISQNKNALTKFSFGELAEVSKNAFCNGPFGSDLLTSELTEEGVPVIYIRDIASGRYKRKSKSCVTEAKAKQLDACAVLPGDLLLAKVGDPPCTAALYPDEAVGAIITQDVIRVRISPQKASAVYLASYLNSPVGRNQIKPIIVQATRARVSLKDLKALPLPLPAIEVQNKIEEVLKELYVAMLQNLRQFEKSEALFASLQSAAFQGRL